MSVRLFLHICRNRFA